MVQAINGARRLNCCFTGEAGHAGTVPMQQRKDALAAAAEWMVFVERTAGLQGGNLVATVGDVQCAPGAVNVIPGEVRLSLDIRGPQDAPLAALLQTLLAEAEAIAGRRRLRFDAQAYYHIGATRATRGCRRRWSRRCGRCRGVHCRCRAARGMTPSLWRNAGRSVCCLCVAREGSAITRRKR